MPLTLRNTKGSALTFSELDDNFSFLQLPVGVCLPYAGSSAPTNFLLCYGQAVSRTTYAALFAAIGTTYGVGDNSTTFNLPDLRGRVAAGKDDMGGSAASRITNATSGITGTTLGAAGGDQRTQSHTHTGTTGTQSANHQHTVGGAAYNFVLGNGGTSGQEGALQRYSGDTITGATDSENATHTHSFTTDATGAGSSQNVQPTMILNYIIRAL